MTLKCKNMTHAMKARRILSDNGITSNVQKINNDPNYNGCIYSIVFDDSYLQEAVALMNRGGVILHKTEKINYGDASL